MKELGQREEQRRTHGREELKKRARQIKVTTDMWGNRGKRRITKGVNQREYRGSKEGVRKVGRVVVNLTHLPLHAWTRSYNVRGEWRLNKPNSKAWKIGL